MMRGLQYAQSLSQAKRLHRLGQLGAAREVYRDLLQAAPEDGDLLGLLGVLAMQEERLDEGEALLRAALKGAGEARIRLRNINNLVALLQRAGKIQSARDLVACGIPPWPAGVVPEPAERVAILSLCSALLLLDRAEAAQRLLDQAFPSSLDDPQAGAAGDPELVGLAGRVSLALGETDRAAGLLARAVAADPEPQTLIAHGYAQQKAGLVSEAEATLGRIARQWPVSVATSPRPRRASILVLNPLPGTIRGPGSTLHDLHFNTNFPAQLAASLSGEYLFQSVFAELPAGTLPQSLPQADVVLNNCVNAEQMNVPRRGDRILEVAAHAGLPVINHPRAVIATTRQKIVALLDGIPNLRVPRIERYRRDPGTPAEIAADIENRFALPVILRRCQSHSSARLQHSVTSSVAILAQDGPALRDYLETLGWPEFYAIEYVPLRRPDGQFRKIRAVLAEDEVIVAIPSFASEWMVGGGRGRANGIAYYRAHPAQTEECRRIVLDPEAVLGRDCLKALEAVRDRLPLDFCGIDFEIDEAGSVVFFEANAAMNLLKRNTEPADITLPDEPFERIKAAFRRAVERRIGGAA